MQLSFPEILKKLRTERGWSRNYLAQKLNISLSLVTKWESTNREIKRDPSTNQLILLANLFNVSVDYLLGRIDIPLTKKEYDIFNDIDKKNLEELLEKYGIPIDSEIYSFKQIKAFAKMIKEFKNTIFKE